MPFIDEIVHLITCSHSRKKEHFSFCNS